MKQAESRIFHVSGWHETYQMLTHGQGIYLYDSEGQRYLDGIGGTHVVSIGYGVEEVAHAMAEQARKVCFSNKTQFTNEPQERLAEVVINLAPQGMDRVIFVTGGSTANEIALQVARYYYLERGYPNKYKIIGRWHSYHGRTIAALSMSGSLFVGREDMAPYRLEFPHIRPPHCYQCPFDLTHPKCELACATELAKTIEEEGTETIAAFIAEPIIGGAGSGIVPPLGYYEKIREICDTYDILFIAEEVVTGFGRTGKNFGIEHWTISPDIITTAKGLSSGYAPLGAVIVHEKIVDTFLHGKRKWIPTFFTYSGHPISCAAALVVQNYIIQHHLVERCKKMGEYLKQELQKLAQREPLIGDVRGKGLLIGLEFVQNRETRQAFPRSMQFTEKLVQTALKQGLILRGRFGTGTKIEGDHVLTSPPFIITENECHELISLLESSLQEVKHELSLDHIN